VKLSCETRPNYITLYERYHFFGPPCIYRWAVISEDIRFSYNHQFSQFIYSIDINQRLLALLFISFLFNWFLHTCANVRMCVCSLNRLPNFSKPVCKPYVLSHQSWIFQTFWREPFSFTWTTVSMWCKFTKTVPFSLPFSLARCRSTVGLRVFLQIAFFHRRLTRNIILLYLCQVCVVNNFTLMSNVLPPDQQSFYPSVPPGQQQQLPPPQPQPVVQQVPPGHATVAYYAPVGQPQQQSQHLVIRQPPAGHPFRVQSYVGHIVFSCGVFLCCGGLFGLIAFIFASEWIYVELAFYTCDCYCLDN